MLSTRHVLGTLLILAAAGCFSPTLDCVFRCGEGGRCPGDLTCGRDGVCHDDPASLCRRAPFDDPAVVEPPDAAPAAPAVDAAEAPPPDAGEPPPPPDAGEPPPPPDAALDAGPADARPADAALPPDAAPPDAPPPIPDAAPPDAAGCTGNVTTVDDYVDDEAEILDTRLAIDVDGAMHVTFVSRTGSEIQISNAWRPASDPSWTVEPISPASDLLIGQALDDRGVLHVCFSGKSRELVYARRDGARWITEAMIPISSSNSALAIDGDHGVHIVLQSGERLIAVERPAGTAGWSTQTIAPSVVAAQPSLAFQPSGALAVVYRSGVLGLSSSLYFASRTGGATWDKLTVVEGGQTGNYPAMVVTPSGKLVVAYGDYVSRDLRLTSWSSGVGPSHSILDSAAGVGKYNSALLDRNGDLQVAYLDYAVGEIEHLRYDLDASTVERRTLEVVGQIHGRTSLALDPGGGLWVAFPSAIHGHVRVARICPVR